MKSIAIIGTGIAGLTSAYYLSRQHRVTVFEANDYIGGHTHTIDVRHDGEQSAIDTGFIVFNDRTYPRFIRLLGELGVAYQPTEMSFSVRNDAIGLEYNGHNLSSLFAQRTNLANPAFLRMLADIVRFNRRVRSEASRERLRTIGDYLDEHRFGSLFADNYLLPMIAAIWSMGLDDVRAFPLRFFARFFENHGLLNVVDRPQWYTIVGGSSSYIEPLTAPFKDSIRLSSPVERIVRDGGSVQLTSNGRTEAYDEVVLACHGDEALALIGDPSVQERAVLGKIRFTDNDVILHTDERILPRQRRAWASWNYRLNPARTGRSTLTYNMNMLQRLNRRHTYLVTLNEQIDEAHVLARFRYHHPAYDAHLLEAQEGWPAISGVDRLHFCGAYWFNGFHEDGVRSALRVCSALGVTV